MTNPARIRRTEWRPSYHSVEIPTLPICGNHKNLRRLHRRRTRRFFRTGNSPQRLTTAMTEDLLTSYFADTSYFTMVQHLYACQDYTRAVRPRTMAHRPRSVNDAQRHDPSQPPKVAAGVYCPERWRLEYGLGMGASNQPHGDAGTEHHEMKRAPPKTVLQQLDTVQ